MNEVHEIGSAISDWRNELPQALRLDYLTHWDASNVWSPAILAFSYRLECLFYRTVCRRLESDGVGDTDRLRQRLLGAMFELNTILRRAMVHGVICAGPPSL